MPVKEIAVSLKLPYIGEISGKWEPDKCQKKASWELYVELVTRISVVNLEDDKGIIREALSSLYSIFETSREIMKRYGPSVAISSGDIYLLGI